MPHSGRRSAAFPLFRVICAWTPLLPFFLARRELNFQPFFSQPAFKPALLLEFSGHQGPFTHCLDDRDIPDFLPRPAAPSGLTGGRHPGKVKSAEHTWCFRRLERRYWDPADPLFTPSLKVLRAV